LVARLERLEQDALVRRVLVDDPELRRALGQQVYSSR
jgi:hypothetical protein